MGAPEWQLPLKGQVLGKQNCWRARGCASCSKKGHPSRNALFAQIRSSLRRRVAQVRTIRSGVYLEARGALADGFVNRVRCLFTDRLGQHILRRLVPWSELAPVLPRVQ